MMRKVIGRTSDRHTQLSVSLKNTNKMSFGKLFQSEDTPQLQPDFEKFYKSFVEDEIRRQTVSPDPQKSILAQQIGRCLTFGADSPEVLARVNRTYRSNAKDSEASSGLITTETLAPSRKQQTNFLHAHSGKRQSSGPVLSLTAAIVKDNHRNGGKFHVPDVADSYEERFLVTT